MFYISCALGFEEQLALEIKECWPWLIEADGRTNQHAQPDIVIERGGVLVDCPLGLGVQLNFFLKTAHRVLWRLAEFRVRDFPKLFEKVRQIPWGQHLEKNTGVEWVVSASQSRLNHEKRIEETCQAAFAKYFGAEGAQAAASQAVYVRVYDDQCSISLDSSGIHLHKRGWGVHKGDAPLRETLAAFVMRQMIEDTTPAELQEVTLVDPMCGSGTLLLEAASLWQPNFFRDFPFLHWKQTPKIFKTDLWRKNYKLLTSQSPFKAYRGYDRDAKVLEAAQNNLGDLQVQMQIAKLDMQFFMQDLFASEIDGEFSEKSASEKTWCVCNPPYGERLWVQGTQDFSYGSLFVRIVEKFKADRIGLLLPNKSAVKNLNLPANFEKLTEVHFSNGGLDVVLIIVEPQSLPTH